ncbi:NUPL2 protein, partial [Alectura lathami]|nr:NUPL2 protein [Alectura lathami]
AGTARGAGGGSGAANQRYANVIRPSTFNPNTWGDSNDHGRGHFASSCLGSPGSGQNSFSAAGNPNVDGGCRDEEEKLLDCVVKDLKIWESSGQWLFSCYSPMKDKPNVTGFLDLSPEELRLEYYNCRANNNVKHYTNSVQLLEEQWKKRVRELKVLNASTKAALLSQLKNAAPQTLPSLGSGGQQTSGLGLSSLPVNSSGTSANSFSFKTNASVTSASSGNTAAFGRPSAGGNPPAFGMSPSPSVSHPVGSGSLSAPSAASFSFKTSATTSGFGTSVFAGFGSSSAVNSSSTAPLAASGASSAAAAPSLPSSAWLGQTASTSGYSATSAPAAATSSTASGSLYTPRGELSAEELQQFEAKKFTMGKIPLKPPPADLLHV